MIRQRLRQLEEELIESRATAADDAKAPPLDQCAVGRLSRMDAMQGREIARDQELRRRARLMTVRAALARLEDGDYGECEQCGELIAAGRLEIDPAARYCVACADGAAT